MYVTMRKSGRSHQIPLVFSMHENNMENLKCHYPIFIRLQVTTFQQNMLTYYIKHSVLAIYVQLNR